MTDERLDDEEAIIRTFFVPLAAGYPGAFGLKDDCAAITPPAGMDLVVKTDPVRAGVHFFADDDPADVAWKALAVNVSDLIAKGATPLAYLAALSFPDAPPRAWLQSFAAGLGEAQAAFGCHLVGGDTDRAPGPISVAITVIGAVPSGRMIRRDAAEPGDLVFVSGEIGDAGLGLLLRSDAPETSAWPLTPLQRESLIRRYFRPAPRVALVEPLRAHARAAMDLSDGLVKDLDRLCRAAGRGAAIRLFDVPMSAAAKALITADPSRRHRAVVAGDDYEVLCTVPPSLASAFREHAAAAGVTVTCIGEITQAQGLRVLDDAGHEAAFTTQGWDHFSPRRG